LALLATGAEGTTVFEGVGELRVKESDRLAAIEEGLSILGFKAYSKGDTLVVEGGAPASVSPSSTTTPAVAPQTPSSSTTPSSAAPLGSPSSTLPATVQNQSTMRTYGDHRLAMTWTMANRVFGLHHHIDDEACIAVSYPDFLNDLERLSGKPQ
jgi:3-phosphoshikimate 1-carboxyvinyltransferase